MRTPESENEQRSYLTDPSQNSDFLIRALWPGKTGCENVVNADEGSEDKVKMLESLLQALDTVSL